MNKIKIILKEKEFPNLVIKNEVKVDRNNLVEVPIKLLIIYKEMEGIFVLFF